MKGKPYYMTTEQIDAYMSNLTEQLDIGHSLNFPCDRCGACCRTRGCEHVTKDNLCDIYERKSGITVGSRLFNQPSFSEPISSINNPASVADAIPSEMPAIKSFPRFLEPRLKLPTKIGSILKQGQLIKEKPIFFPPFTDHLMPQAGVEPTTSVLGGPCSIH